MSRRARRAAKAEIRELAAALRTPEQRAAGRRRRVLLVGGAVGLVVAVVLGLGVANVVDVGDAEPAPPRTGAPDDSPVVRAVTSVPPRVLDRVGVGRAQRGPVRIDAPALTADGKPKVLYVGAEFCSYCAAERWPLVVALSRFGAWSGLSTTTSASDDVFPDTPTMSFAGARYRSDYLAFTGVETHGSERVGGEYAPLDRLGARDRKVFDTYGRPPYTSGAPGAIPFIDFGGEYVSSGASYSPGVLVGRNHRQIADALDEPNDIVAQSVDGSANLVTAVLCELTGGEPGEVCTSDGVQAAAAALAAAQE